MMGDGRADNGSVKAFTLYLENDILCWNIHKLEISKMGHALTIVGRDGWLPSWKFVFRWQIQKVGLYILCKIFIHFAVAFLCLYLAVFQYF